MSAVLYGKGIIGGAVALLLTGCMTNFMEKPYPYDYEKSTALNVLTASGIVADSAPQVDDTPQWYIESKKRLAAKEGKQIESPSEVATSGTGVSSDTSLNVVGGSLFATGTATALPGFSSMGSAAFFMLPSLFDTKVWPYQYDSWIVWVPKVGKSAEQASQEIVGVFEDVLRKRFPDNAIYSNSPYIKGTHQTLKRLSLNAKENKLETKITKIQLSEPANGYLPEWLGSGEAYVWGIRPHKHNLPVNEPGGIHVFISGCGAKVYKKDGHFDLFSVDEDQFSARQCMLELTREMPANIAYYSSPQTFTYLPFYEIEETKPVFNNKTFHKLNSEKIFYKGKNVPLIMNQGRAFFFIEPTKEVQQARTGMDLLLSKERLAEVQKVRTEGKNSTVGAKVVSEKQETIEKGDSDGGFFSKMKKLASETTEKAVKVSSDMYESAKESI